MLFPESFESSEVELVSRTAVNLPDIWTPVLVVITKFWPDWETVIAVIFELDAAIGYSPEVVVVVVVVVDEDGEDVVDVVVVEDGEVESGVV